MNHQETRILPMGQSRSRVTAEHALITPDTHVWSPLPDAVRAESAVHISPELGARFVQQTIRMGSNSSLGPAAPGVERFIYVIDGDIEFTADDQLQELESGDYAFLPADGDLTIISDGGARLATFEKILNPPDDDEPLPTVVASAADVPAESYEGDEAKGLQKLLPDEQRFDMAVNIFSYQPGAALPQVEIHVMEHGLLMLEGAGVYRLGDSWYPVEAGDVIWMASFCPQWFVAMGKQPARYLYYKDVNRDPLA